ncbi:MAG: inositol monophosphatase [Litorilinea sp.]|nr:MAG: inositol monophosphatase [Litorilinea sp.]
MSLETEMETPPIEAVIAVARQAGQLVWRMQRQGLQQIREKSSAIDLVTEADVASENLIRQALQDLAPHIGFWGEESNHRPDDEYFWIVDPIDGTINFANQVPFCAVNIALNRGETTLLGVTLELPAQRVFWAVRGQGAFVREPSGVERPLAVNRRTELAQALLTTGFPYHRATHADNNSAEFTYFLTRAQAVRCMGAAALDLAYVAAGAFAGYWEGWLNPWDAAPGVLMVREAGGRVTDYSGAEWTLSSSSLIASNGQPSLHEALLRGIQSARAGLPSTLLPDAATA